MDEISLSDASLSEVCARVAYRLIERRRSYYPWVDTHDIDLLGRLARQLDKRGWKCMSFWVSAYARSSACGEQVEFTRTAFIMRARLGMDFRSVAYIDYKAPRRRDPRVTNRGVATKAKPEVYE